MALYVSTKIGPVRLTQRLGGTRHRSANIRRGGGIGTLLAWLIIGPLWLGYLTLRVNEVVVFVPAAYIVVAVWDTAAKQRWHRTAALTGLLRRLNWRRLAKPWGKAVQAR